MTDPTPIPCTYRFEGHRHLRVDWRGDDRWAITETGFCLNKNGEWEYERFPSSRSDEFIKRCRFTLDDAFRRVANYLSEEEKHNEPTHRSTET